MDEMDSRYIGTHSGGRVHIFNPRPEEILIEDIEWALGNMCRYNGHCAKFYSVAEHSVYVSMQLSGVEALAALLHDAAEAFLGDIVRPIRRHPNLGFFGQIEEALLAVIAEKFGLPLPIPAAVWEADNNVLITELSQIMPGADLTNPHLHGYKILQLKIKCLPPRKASALFHARYLELSR